MKRFRLTDRASQRIQAGGRLIKLEDFEKPEEIETAKEGLNFFISDASQSFTGQAIVGRQNKGFAWVFSLDTYDYWSPDFIDYLLKEAISKREELFTSQETTAFRLFNGEGDGLGGLTIDWYDSYLQLTWYSRGMYQYLDWWLEALTGSGLEIEGIYQTKRFAVSEDEQSIEHLWGQEADDELIVKENGIQYACYLGKEWMTGLFLDQREVRDFIQTQADGLSVLNLFSYTGAFSIAAAVGGSSKTVSIDVANRSTEMTQRNFELNDIEYKTGQHEVRIMDVFDYIAYARRNNLTFDLIVCDPPSFARTKQYTFSALKDYADLAKDLFSLTAPGGLCILSTNHSMYSQTAFQDDINEVAKKTKRQTQLIQSFGLPNDFPTSQDNESQYLKVLVYYCA